MPLSVAIQMDPIETIDVNGDSSLMLALEAQRRGHTVTDRATGSLRERLKRKRVHFSVARPP